ncbi:MAG: L-fucose/L-arabinose isomerase family protein [Puniceicoccales bacterium]|jgi:L-arabinose isomerase|nr:L-fucose/L-arabinose isomerase family protein [Puniceicoccales bacterium]
MCSENTLVSVNNKKVKAGLLGVGLDTYWPQFAGLRERLLGYQNEIAARMGALGAEVVDAGLVDNPAKAADAAALLRREGVEILFLFISTYALSSTVLPVAQRLGVPVVLLNTQPVPAIDYARLNALGDRGKMTGEWLAHCQACSAPEFASVFNRAGVRYEIISGWLGEAAVWEEAGEWLAAAHVVAGMRDNRLGVLGHYYCGMLDVYTDTTRQSAVFGTHIELLEMCELRECRDGATGDAVAAKLGEFTERFDVSPQCEPAELERAARTAVALDALVARHRLGALAYYYEGRAGNEYEDIATSVIAGNTLLTGAGVPVAGECEIKNAQAMKIMSLLGAGGSFSEFYALDFNDDIVMLGHDGPAHFAIAQGRVGLVPVPVYHGKPGKGLSIQMSVKHGPVTLLSVCENRDGVFLLVAQGESVAGPVLQIGNTNSRYRFSIGAKRFINEWSKHGPSHHCAIGVGHLAGTLEKTAKLLGIPFARVC